MNSPGFAVFPQTVSIAAEGVWLAGDLSVPIDARGVVLFAHGSGSGRHSPRNQFVARHLQDSGLGTLLFDLLTPEEELADTRDGHLRFNIPLLSRRLVRVARWLKETPATRHLGLGFFGASTGGAAALLAAAELAPLVQAVVSRGGRPDLAAEVLPQIMSPTLLIVGELDESVLRLNQRAFARLRGEKQLAVIRGATHLFEEPGALEEVAALSSAWFQQHLQRSSS